VKTVLCNLFAQYKLFLYFSRKFLKKVRFSLNFSIKMPQNKNLMIRLTTIDRCLRNHFRLWTIDDLIDACSDALYEYEGIDSCVSLRTVRNDIALMRSDKLGYNAPIVVRERKYYTYEDPDYSITQHQLSEQDVQVLSRAVDVVRQYQDFDSFGGADDIISRLEDHLNTAILHRRPVIYLDTNKQLRGLKYISELYHYIIHKQVAVVTYRSFKAKDSHVYKISAYLLKEFNNRWFVLCTISGHNSIYTLALDRIVDIKKAENAVFQENTFFDENTYFDNLIGVSKHLKDLPIHVILHIDNDQAPYVLTKPLHPTQQLLSQDLHGITVSIDVVHNIELEARILTFGHHIIVKSPHSLRDRIKRSIQLSLDNYLMNT
jgi:predicted DNA-binding transcriptional regulator YafY